ncbi:MAG: hypothetical protein R6U46_04365 [Marinilabilia sp.]
MIQRDYILRMIEEIGRFLAKISGLRDDHLNEKGLNEFFEFMEGHFGLKAEDIHPDNLAAVEEKLRSSFDNFPDELGQLCLSGAEMAEIVDQRTRAQTLYMLAWEAYQSAENEAQTFRFDRIVEMNTVRDRLALMGINVGENE